MRITIDIPDEIHAELKALAKKEGTTMRAILLQAIDAQLKAKDAAQTLAQRRRFPTIPSTRKG